MPKCCCQTSTRNFAPLLFIFFLACAHPEIVDFGSYTSAFFGFNKMQGYEKMKFIKPIYDKRLSKDKYCPDCDHRLSFLRFVSKARKMNSI